MPQKKTVIHFVFDSQSMTIILSDRYPSAPIPPGRSSAEAFSESLWICSCLKRNGPVWDSLHVAGWEWGLLYLDKSMVASSVLPVNGNPAYQGGHPLISSWSGNRRSIWLSSGWRMASNRVWCRSLRQGVPHLLVLIRFSLSKLKILSAHIAKGGG